MNQLQNFGRMILEKHGAAVDVIEPEGLEVLAPREVQEVLHIPEWVRLGFGAELPTDAQRVSLDADLLERLGLMLGEHGRFTRLVINPTSAVQRAERLNLSVIGPLVRKKFALHLHGFQMRRQV